VPRSGTPIVTSTGLLDPRLPPRPMVSRTRSSPPSTPSPDIAAGSSRSSATGHEDPDLPPPAPRPVPPGPPRLNRSTGVQGPCRSPAVSAGGGLPIEPYYLPVLPHSDRLLRDRSAGQKPHCTTPATSALTDPMSLSLDLVHGSSGAVTPDPLRTAGPVTPRPPRHSRPPVQAILQVPQSVAPAADVQHVARVEQSIQDR
jgi:hypothetical protein